MIRLRLYFFVLVWVSFSCLTAATDVKWTPGKDDPKNAAHTAPRSQKYWNEHGIERPDYAKTDAEIAQEKGGGAIKWILLIPIVAGVGYYFRLQMGGHMLGGLSLGSIFHRMSEEDARQARLAKFDRGISIGKAE